jgi:type IV pilus assembly protein PilQ
MLFRHFNIIGGIILVIISMVGTISSQSQEQEPARVREELISLDVRDKPFGEILTGIAEQTGKNIIYDDDVKDILVTLKVVNVPWQSVLEIIAKKYNCLIEEITGTGVMKISKPPTVTMEFEEADIRDVINQIATIANRNIVVAEAVRGAISLRLKNVPWQDALEAIIKTRGYVLVREKDDRILRVVPQQDIETQMETQIFKLRFIRPKASQVALMTSPYFEKKEAARSTTGSVEVSNFSLLNALNVVVTPGRGRVTYDEQTNTIIITDVKPKIDEMARIINELDKEPRQVFVDVKFVRTTNSDIFDFGIDTGEDGIQISQGFGAMPTRLPFSLGRTGFEDAIAAAPQADLDAGVPTDADLAGKTFTFGTLDFSKTSFTLRLLKRDTKSKIVQAPKIITLDNHEATIFVGRTISFARSNLVQNDNGSQSIEMREAEGSPAREGFQILVVPHIIPGTNKIQITVIPSNDQLTGSASNPAVPGFNRFTTQGANIDLPEITQQVVVTHMLLESGQTAVLGGLLTVSQQESVRKIPFLGDIPFFGYFFKSKSVTKRKEDMFIFVTPKIVQSSEDSAEKIQALVDQERKQYGARYTNIWKEEAPTTPTTPATTVKKNR